ncbi:uncharacterized protein K441DRAFT_80314 [Cenococcum geophilum 1.58]|uniref:uncharacterized protein n=1 Tax=Cenococcum geophilum 1.58 TaxID=794803 RepID=UPI00358E2A3D|nr:hypothetical protein K441DRAFT_80314 [Cenococcum geophilum 1.58]
MGHAETLSKFNFHSFREPSSRTSQRHDFWIFVLTIHLFIYASALHRRPQPQPLDFTEPFSPPPPYFLQHVSILSSALSITVKMSADEKTAFGAVVETTTPSHLSQPTPPHSRSAPSHESTLSTIPSIKSTPVTPGEGHDPTNPYSAFYSHPDARRSMDEQTPHSKTRLEVCEYDLESGSPISVTTTVSPPKLSVDGRVKECTMWPSKQTMMERAKARKREQSCAPFRNLTRKQKLWVKILIALFVVAAAVGLGVGISRAVGGGVWAGNGHNKQIPNGS